MEPQNDIPENAAEQAAPEAPQAEAPKPPKRRYAITLSSNNKLGPDAQLLDPIESLRYINTGAIHERDFVTTKDKGTLFDDIVNAYGVLDLIFSEKEHEVEEEATGRKFQVNGYHAIVIAMMTGRFNRGDPKEPGLSYSTNVMLSIHELHEVEDRPAVAEDATEEEKAAEAAKTYPLVWKVMRQHVSFNLTSTYTSMPTGNI